MTTQLSTVNLYVGLPISVLMGPDAVATAAAAKDFFTGDHVWHADGADQQLHVSSVTIASQPVGAMFDYLLTYLPEARDGKNRVTQIESAEMPPDKKSIFKKEMGIIGIGMNTVDLLVVNQGAPVERFIAGENLGVRRLLELVNRDGLYTLAELDDQLRAGSLDLSTALPIWQREILGLIEKRWENYFKRFSAIIAVGGGSVLMRDALTRRFNGRCLIPEDPVIATARGLYKYALMRSAKSNDTTPIVAFDAGFGSIKIMSKDKQIVMQSAVATNGTRAIGKMVGLKASQRPLHIENYLGSFYVGHGAHQFGRPVESLDFDRLTGSPEMLALFHGSITPLLQEEAAR
jgi:hypothetical protein